MDQRVQVLIVDRDVHTRQGLQALLAVWPQIEVVGAAANSVEAVQLVEKCRPDVVLIDIPMPVSALSPSPEHPFGSTFGRQGRREGVAEGTDGLEVIRRIKSQWPRIRIVVLTMYTAQRAAVLAAGADAFLLKGCPAQDLLNAIDRHASHPSEQG